MAAPKGPRPITRATAMIDEVVKEIIALNDYLTQQMSVAYPEDTEGPEPEELLEHVQTTFPMFTAKLNAAGALLKSRHAGSDTADPNAKKKKASR